MNPTIKKTGILIFSWAISLNIVYSQKISLESLLLEMTNRKTLAEYPSPGYFCKQFSSYDRASVESDQKSWFANWDRSMFVRTETDHGRKEYVLMDAKGPGAIVRMWMTFSGENSRRGVLRIYLDDYFAIRTITLKINAENYEQALRSTIIHISFDGIRTISAPIGDFFGTGYKIRKNHSWYTKVDDDSTMSCYWVMPFKRKCNILLENKGDQNINIEQAKA